MLSNCGAGVLLRITQTTGRSNQSILKEVNPEYSLEGLMLKLKLQYLGYLMRRADLLENTLLLGKIEGKRRRGQQKMTCLDSITDSMDVKLSKAWAVMEDRGAWHATVHGVTKSQTLFSNWTTTTFKNTFLAISKLEFEQTAGNQQPSQVDI